MNHTVSVLGKPLSSLPDEERIGKVPNLKGSEISLTEAEKDDLKWSLEEDKEIENKIKEMSDKKGDEAEITKLYQTLSARTKEMKETLNSEKSTVFTPSRKENQKGKCTRGNPLLSSYQQCQQAKMTGTLETSFPTRNPSTQLKLMKAR